MAKVSDLPNELLYRILSHFPTHGRDMYNICLTSRFLYAAAIPIYTRRCSFRRKPKRGSPASFVAGVLRRQISACIRELFLENWQVRRFPLGGWSYLTDENTRQCLCRAAEEFQFPSEITDEWKLALDDALEDAVFALLLFLADGLEKLVLSLPFTGSNHTPWLFRLLRVAQEIPLSVQPRGLQNLHDVRLESSSGQMFFNLDLVLPLFRLPALRTFRASQCIGSRATCSWEWPQGVSPVESITFENSRLDAGSINILFGACGGIKKFRLNWSRDWRDKETDWIYGDFDHSVLEAALRGQAASLESFEFIDEEYGTSEHYSRSCLSLMTNASPLLCLIELPCLKSVKLPPAWL
ncbi:hypothetical protein DTO271G3_4008 [Paecilomyces variotii]|nr:hypothetical protein DTO271G3_4008 [Paecilomyces variotii]